MQQLVIGTSKHDESTAKKESLYTALEMLQSK